MALAHENSSLNGSCYYSGPTQTFLWETFALSSMEPVRLHSTVPESTPYSLQYSHGSWARTRNVSPENSRAILQVKDSDWVMSLAALLGNHCILFSVNSLVKM